MAVKIKLQRLGKIRSPYYRVIVSDARTRRSGKAIETIGQYRPKEEPSFIQVDSDRAQYWLGVGAQPTESVQRIFEITGDWQKFKGLPGTEGTLKVKEPKTSKEELFAQALKEAGSEPTTDATTPKKRGGGGGGGAKKAADSKPAEAKAEAKTDAKADAKKADEKTETKSEAKADEGAKDES